jgi:hypothetical protein
MSLLTTEEKIKYAKAYGKKHGYKGAKGGWIYAPSGKAVCQGWFEFYCKYKLKILRDRNMSDSDKARKKLEENVELLGFALGKDAKVNGGKLDLNAIVALAKSVKEKAQVLYGTKHDCGVYT